MATRRKDYFKHGWDAHDNTELFQIIEEGGMDAYGSWWLIVELVAEEAWKNKTNKTAEINKVFLRRKLKKSLAKVEQMLNFFQGFSILLWEDSEKNFKITLPNLPKYLGKEGSNDSKGKSNDDIERDKSKEIRVESKVTSSIQKVPPKKSTTTTPIKMTQSRIDALETFYGKDISTFAKGELKQINTGIDKWIDETEYTDLHLFEMVLGYDTYWIDLETSGEVTKYTRSKNILTFLKKDDLFKYLHVDDETAAGTKSVTETEVMEQDAKKFKEFAEKKKKNGGIDSSSYGV